MATCTNCGARLDADARFCPRCGTAVLFPEPAPAPVHTTSTSAAPAATNPKRNSYWWVGPAAIVALVLIAWLVVAGLPLRRDTAIKPDDAEQTETIAEATPPPADPSLGSIPLTTDTALGYGTTQTAPPPVVLPENTVPPPTVVIPPPMVSATPPPPVPAPVTPAPVTPPATTTHPPVSDGPPSVEVELTDQDASASLRRYLTSTDYYEDVDDECMQIQAHGYRNEGYGFSVWNTCAANGGSQRLGVWRVDAHNGEVFVQRDGRYEKP